MNADRLAHTPEPPYFVVIFTSKRTGFGAGCTEMAKRIMAPASTQPGFLGVETAHEDPKGITVSYWQDEESITSWKKQADHQEAQRLGKEHWYEDYCIRLAKVERANSKNMKP